MQYPTLEELDALYYLSSREPTYRVTIPAPEIPIWETWSMDERTCLARVTHRGEFFTVATAEAQVMIPNTGGKTRTVMAEGISRRSSLDNPNPELAGKIATGRAVKALWKKLHNKNVRHKYMA